jgi:hypothetical protein
MKRIITILLIFCLSMTIIELLVLSSNAIIFRDDHLSTSEKESYGIFLIFLISSVFLFISFTIARNYFLKKRRSTEEISLNRK